MISIRVDPTVGASMLAAQRRLRDDPSRGRSFFGDLKLADRFVPVLYQEKVEPSGGDAGEIAADRGVQGGGNLANIAIVLGLGDSPNAPTQLAQQLIGVGLAEMMPYGHLRLHPALPPMMLREMSEAEREEARGGWVEAMTQLVGFLYEQRSKDAQLAAVLGQR